MTEKKLTEEEQRELQKKLEEEKIIEEERLRKKIEKYKMKSIEKWSIAPTLLWVGYFIFALIQYISNKSYDIKYIIIFGIFAILTSAVWGIEGIWATKIKCKYKILAENPSYQFANYEYDYLYTDSYFEFLFINIVKIIFFLINIIAVIITALLLFSWFGSITIAPTTIIIILLIILILK